MQAVLLAGGRGRRMGRPKAHLDIGGTPLWRLVADRLAAGGFAVTIAVGPEHWDTQPYPSVGDSGRGPLDGIAAAFEGDDLMVWTVDVPEVADVTYLVQPGAAVVALRDESGRMQPLLARWPADTAASVDDFLASGGRSVMSFLDHHPVVLAGPPRHRAHLTTPSDVEAWLGSV